MNELQIFNNEEFGEIRTFADDDKILFCATDVAKALGYATPRDAVLRHCKGVVKRDTPTSSGVQSMSYIYEGDLYRLIVSSKLPSAEKFEKWVFDEVLPSIRKNGGYIAGQETMSDDELLAKALMVAQNKIAERDKQIEQMKPKANYFDALVDRKLNTNIRDTAKEIGIKEKEFTSFLINNGYCFRQSGKLRPYAQFCESGKGYFVLKDYKSLYSGHAGTQMLITPRGKETFRLLIGKE